MSMVTVSVNNLIVCFSFYTVVPISGCKININVSMKVLGYPGHWILTLVLV